MRTHSRSVTRDIVNLPKKREALGGPGRLSSRVFTKMRRRIFDKSHVAAQRKAAWSGRLAIASVRKTRVVVD